MGSPLWQRGVRGDFIKISDSIGVKVINRLGLHRSENDVKRTMLKGGIPLCWLINFTVWAKTGRII